MAQKGWALCLAHA